MMTPASRRSDVVPTFRSAMTGRPTAFAKAPASLAEAKRRRKGLHYTSVLLALGFLAHVSAQQQQRADVRPPATVTVQAYPAEQVQAGQTAFASRCGFCHGRDTAGGEAVRISRDRHWWPRTLVATSSRH
jgi:mono/diheme cytochrome c family protein